MGRGRAFPTASSTPHFEFAPFKKKTSWRVVKLLKVKSRKSGGVVIGFMRRTVTGRIFPTSPSLCARGPHLLILALACSLLSVMQTAFVARSAAPVAWLGACRIPVFDRAGRSGGVASRPLPDPAPRPGSLFAGRACAKWPGALASSAWVPRGRRGVATGAKAKEVPDPAAAAAEAEDVEEAAAGEDGPAAVAPLPEKQTTEEINDFWEKCMEQVRLAPWEA